MIRIFDFNTVSDREIFGRTQDAFNVEDIVSEIISNVKTQKDAALLA